MLPLRRSSAHSPGSGALDTAGSVRAPILLFTVGYFVLVERAVTGFRALRPRVLLDLPAAVLAARAVLEGAVHRLYPDVQRHPIQERRLAPAGGAGRPPGLRRRLLDHGADPGQRSAAMPPSTRGASCRAIPWRTAPSSPATSPSAPGCTVGTGAFVHYGVTMGDGAVLDADSFLMKGEHVRAGARGGGQPRRRGTSPSGPSRPPPASARQRVPPRRHAPPQPTLPRLLPAGQHPAHQHAHSGP